MAAARKLEIKTTQIELNGDFQGWTFTARTNLPVGAYADMQSGQWERVMSALAETVIDWNFVDEDGDPMPSVPEARKTRRTQKQTGKYDPGNDPVKALMRPLTADLVTAMIEAFGKWTGQPSPNSSS